MIIINETIRTDLIVFLALFADLATIAVAYDNAHYEQRPVEWQLPKIWVISVVLGLLLALSTWIMRGSFYLPGGGMVQNFGNVQLMLFLQVSLVENWLIFVTRGGETWPNWKLVGAILVVDAISTLFCCFGMCIPLFPRRLLTDNQAGSLESLRNSSPYPSISSLVMTIAPRPRSSLLLSSGAIRSVSSLSSPWSTTSS